MYHPTLLPASTHLVKKQLVAKVSVMRVKVLVLHTLCVKVVVLHTCCRHSLHSKCAKDEVHLMHHTLKC